MRHCWLFYCLAGLQLWASNGYAQAVISSSIDSNSCKRILGPRSITYECPSGPDFEQIDLANLTSTYLEDILTLTVRGENSNRGRLISIPSNICQLKKLTILDLANNKIQKTRFNFSPPCLPELWNLNLADNQIREIPVDWIRQMPRLSDISFRKNSLTCLPYNMSRNISQIRKLDVSFNSLTTFEFWTIQVQEMLDLQYNQIDRVSNNFNVDMFDVRRKILPTILLVGNPKIHFDDAIFAMYNRCIDVHLLPPVNALYESIFISTIVTLNGSFLWECACSQYHLYETIFFPIWVTSESFFFNWICSKDTEPYAQKCKNQSSVNFSNVEPRLCKIDAAELGYVPRYIDSNACGLTTNPDYSSLESISLTVRRRLEDITTLNYIELLEFVSTIHDADFHLRNISNRTVTPKTEENFQAAINQIEELIASITTLSNTSNGPVAIYSVQKNSTLYTLNQIVSNNSIFYSSAINDESATTSISINTSAIEKLNETDIYTFYYLPSSLFQYAIISEPELKIIEPVVGVYLPKKQQTDVQMFFTDIDRPSGTYSCGFWQKNQWNNSDSSGCVYSKRGTRHHCHCDHLTSFALIFTPDQTLDETYLPSLIFAFLSIICLSIAIVLAVCQQIFPRIAPSPRHLSFANIFALSSTLILFILLTITIIKGNNASTVSPGKQIQCQSSSRDFALVTYFFVILTFAAKTLLGICYFLTLFFHFMLVRFAFVSSKWFLVSFILVLVLALIPTIVAIVLAHQWTNVLVQYKNICWFEKSLIFKFVSIPVLVFVSVNVLIILVITVRLLQSYVCHTTVRTSERRLVVALLIWITSCVSLGVIWIAGPFLDIFTRDTGRSLSSAQWIFALFIGLEGLWVLIVNIIFYFNQRANFKHGQSNPKQDHGI